MAEESRRDTNSIEQTSYRKFLVTVGYDDYKEIALARLAARYESSARIEQITRTSPSPPKELKGWRDQFMRMISTRKQRQITYGQERRSHSEEKERRTHIIAGCCSKVVSEELIFANKITVPSLHSGNPFCRPGGYKVASSMNPVPNLKSLSTIKGHLSAANKRPNFADTANRSFRRAKEEPKQKKLRNGDNSRLQHPSSIRSNVKFKREGMMTYPVFQLDPAAPSLSHFLAAQNELNSKYRPSVLERLILKGELLLSSLLRPGPAAENLGFQDPLIKFTSIVEEAGGKSKETLINYSFAVTPAFNVPITGNPLACKSLKGLPVAV